MLQKCLPSPVRQASASAKYALSSLPLYSPQVASLSSAKCISRRFFTQGNENDLGGFITNKYSTTMTACGRTFDPNILLELIRASQDKRWLQAIHAEMSKDREYMRCLLHEGASGLELQKILMTQDSNDDNFMGILSDRLREDRKAALSVCAMQDAFVAIKKRRDLENTRRAAQGNEATDPTSQLKSGVIPFQGNNP